MNRGLTALTAIAAAAAIWHVGTRYDLDLGLDRDRQPGAAVGTGPDATPVEDESIPAPPRAVVPPGSPFEVALFGEPARWYAQGPATPIGAAASGAPEGDPRRLVALAAASAPATVLYDADLARAAAEVALLTARLGEPPPESALPFLLHTAGAPEIGAALFVTHTTSEADAAIVDTARRALAQPPPSDGPLRVGVGEAASPGDRFTRHVAVLVARRDWDMDRAPTSVAPGATWQASLRIPASWRDLDAHVLLPDGAIAPATLARTGEAATLSVVAPDLSGASLQVAIDGTGPRGPGKLLQLTVWIGDPPRQITVHTADADPPDLDDSAGSQRAFALLQADRTSAGLPALVFDPALAEVARTHSLDMRDHGFFGHRSPTTGEVVDRLDAARYRRTSSGENLARNDSLAEAQAALMASVGHRANILEPRFTHAGVGAVRIGGDWIVTQVFARPVEALPFDAAARIVARVAEARAAQGLPPLAPRGDLAAIAARHAPEVAASGVAGVTDRVSTEIRPLVARAAMVSTHQVGELAEIALPDAALDAAMTQIGTAAWQDATTGRVGAVIVIAR